MRRRVLPICLLIAQLSAAEAAPKTRIITDCTHKLDNLLTEVDPQAARTDAEFDKPRTAGISVFAVLPADNAQYRAVYGKKAIYSEAAKTELDAGIDTIRKLSSSADVMVSARGKADLDKLLKGAKDRITVLIGHNENGVFRFANGQSMAVTEIADRCAGAGTFCVFLTCEADKLLAGQKCAAGAKCNITAKHATSALSAAIGELVPAGSQPQTALSGRKFWASVESHLHQEQRQTQVKYVVAASGVVIAVLITIYALSADDEDGKQIESRTP